MKIAQTFLEDAEAAVMASVETEDHAVTFGQRKAFVFVGKGAEDRAIATHGQKLESGVIPLGGVQTTDSKWFFIV